MATGAVRPHPAGCPCSATGVIRRHPDIKWLRRDQDIRELAELQRRILDALWGQAEKQGGTLLYATCSVLPEENREQIRAFLADTPDARLVPLHAEDTPACPGRQFLPARRRWTVSTMPSSSSCRPNCFIRRMAGPVTGRLITKQQP